MKPETLNFFIDLIEVTSPDYKAIPENIATWYHDNHSITFKQATWLRNNTKLHKIIIPDEIQKEIDKHSEPVGTQTHIHKQIEQAKANQPEVAAPGLPVTITVNLDPKIQEQLNRLELAINQFLKLQY